MYGESVPSANPLHRRARHDWQLGRYGRCSQRRVVILNRPKKHCGMGVLQGAIEEETTLSATIAWVLGIH